jgi:hypothetical protein
MNYFFIIFIYFLSLVLKYLYINFLLKILNKILFSEISIFWILRPDFFIYIVKFESVNIKKIN